MGKMARFALIGVGAIVLLIALVAVCLPLFLNADSFRARIESTLTKSLGRKVTIGKLELAVGRAAWWPRIARLRTIRHSAPSLLFRRIV
jgi:uncharacterized protein involved in outer membrane biogenesis